LVDDAGTIQPAAWELELSSAHMDRNYGPARAYSIAARAGLHRTLDSGLALAWTDPAAGGSDLLALVLDLKWAPGSAHRWRPRPFFRTDFALSSVDAQAEATFAAFCSGLTWE